VGSATVSPFKVFCKVHCLQLVKCAPDFTLVIFMSLNLLPFNTTLSFGKGKRIHPFMESSLLFKNGKDDPLQPYQEIQNDF